MFGKKKSDASKARRNGTVIRETLERIVIRTRNIGQVAYCASCGKLTRCLTPEQAAEIFRSSDDRPEAIHLTEVGPARLICAESMVTCDEKEDEKEK